MASVRRNKSLVKLFTRRLSLFSCLFLWRKNPRPAAFDLRFCLWECAETSNKYLYWLIIIHGSCVYRVFLLCSTFVYTHTVKALIFRRRLSSGSKYDGERSGQELRGKEEGSGGAGYSIWITNTGGGDTTEIRRSSEGIRVSRTTLVAETRDLLSRRFSHYQFYTPLPLVILQGHVLLYEGERLG